ncbi:p21-activated protein kinase-interacting protein 1-like [Oppia nitens]|uniref:p21-activated protein kinase-interacting protein 1-like n=1 Tax=Oppia nitens TaxID=1686743 RepID=UPI0023DCE1F5|nr:p21-activated protein kinase-interacting protein 1-like [Oppia nitens]
MTTMEIIVGTYEEFLIGYQLKCIDGSYALEQSFADRAHCGSVRCLSTSPKFMVSGSTDEVIHIFNMYRRSDSGTLNQHSGTITDLEFYKTSHLFSASEDGTVCVWETRSWVCEKTLRGHKDAITSISIHPSGKLMLSVSKDKTLRTWNLIKGRCAYVTNIKAIAHIVQWSPGCTHFAVVINNRIDIYDISTGGVVNTIDFSKRIHCILYLNNDVMAIGNESSDIQIYDLKNKCIINTFTAHNNRLKCLVKTTEHPDIKENRVWMTSVSSDSYIKIWELDLSNLKLVPKMIASVDTTCRPTCLSVRVVSDVDKISDENVSQTSETSENINVTKKRKNKSKDKVSNKKVET